MKQLLIGAAVVAAGCASSPENDNFRQVMERQVGKRADDADFYPMLYRLKQTNSQRLPNGNVKEEFAAGRNGKCKVAFEVAPDTRQVVRWSSEGEPGDCVIARPR